jgi:hypothetical protein
MKPEVIKRGGGGEISLKPGLNFVSFLKEACKTSVVISGYEILECLSLIRSSNNLPETNNRPTVSCDVTPFTLVEIHGISGKCIPFIFTVKE